MLSFYVYPISVLIQKIATYANNNFWKQAALVIRGFANCGFENLWKAGKIKNNKKNTVLPNLDPN